MELKSDLQQAAEAIFDMIRYKIDRQSINYFDKPAEIICSYGDIDEFSIYCFVQVEWYNENVYRVEITQLGLNDSRTSEELKPDYTADDLEPLVLQSLKNYYE